ncbi:MAG: glycosyltransferase, partial [Bacteroidetes bacterium]|nr:glycosyltransferase [Bacteroidota bacterium]
MPKVLRIINRFNLGGPTYNVSYLSRYMANGYETLLIGGVPDSDEADSTHIFSEMGLSPMILEDLKRNPHIKDDVRAYVQIKKIIQEFKPDIVHTHASKAGALGRLAAIKLKVPIIVHTYHGHVFSGYFSKFKTFVYKTIEQYLARKSTGIVVISPEQLIDLSERHHICEKQKMRMIPLGFDLDRFQENHAEKRKFTREKYSIADDEVAVAIIGRLVPIKNHPLFIQALNQIDGKTKIKIKAFIVGGGSDKDELIDFSEDLVESKNIDLIFTSWVKEIDVFNAGMDIICLTSLNEGTPVSLIEAQASGVAVLSTDVGGVRHVVEDGQTGILVPSNDVDAFAEKLLLLVENKEKRKFLSQNGWNSV